MTPQQITEALRLADSHPPFGQCDAWVFKAADLLRTLAAQAAQEQPAVDVDALMELADDYVSLSHGLAPQRKSEARNALRAALEGLK